MKMPRKSTGPKHVSEHLGKMEKATSGRPRLGKKSGLARRSSDLVQKMLGLCEAETGPKLMDCCKPELLGTKERDKMLKRIQILEDGRVPAKKGQKLEDRRTQEENHLEGKQKTVELV